MTIILAAKSGDGICFLSDTYSQTISKENGKLKFTDETADKVELVRKIPPTVALGISGDFYFQNYTIETVQKNINFRDVYTKNMGDVYSQNVGERRPMADRITNAVAIIRAYHESNSTYFAGENVEIKFLFGIVADDNKSKKVLAFEKQDLSSEDADYGAIGSGSYPIVRNCLAARYQPNLSAEKVFEVLAKAFNLALGIDAVNKNILKGYRAKVLSSNGLEEYLLPPGMIHNQYREMR